jgi:hypothetical protein
MARKKTKVEDEEISPEEQDGALKDLLKEDGDFKKFRNIIKHVAETNDLEELEKEARRLHSGRPARSLAGKTPGAQLLLEAELQDGSNRSRLSQIRVDMEKMTGVVEEALDAIRAHIQWRYGVYLPAGGTKSDRQLHLNKYLRKGVKLQSDIKTFATMLDFYITDIDKMAYKLTNTKDILEMIYSSKGAQ